MGNKRNAVTFRYLNAHFENFESVQNGRGQKEHMGQKGVDNIAPNELIYNTIGQKTNPELSLCKCLHCIEPKAIHGLGSGNQLHPN